MTLTQCHLLLKINKYFINNNINFEIDKKYFYTFLLQNNYIVAKSDGEDKRTKYLPTEEGTINGIIYGDNILQVDKLKLNNELLKKIKSKTEISTISKYAKMVNEILEDEYIYFSVDNNTFYSYLVKNEYLDEYVINNRKNKNQLQKVMIVEFITMNLII